MRNQEDSVASVKKLEIMIFSKKRLKKESEEGHCIHWDNTLYIKKICRINRTSLTRTIMWINQGNIVYLLVWIREQVKWVTIKATKSRISKLVWVTISWMVLSSIIITLIAMYLSNTKRSRLNQIGSNSTEVVTTALRIKVLVEC